MSDDEIVVGVPLKEEEGAPELPREERPKYKSWRKKYRKMKVHFDERLKFNNRLYKEEQKLEALARRIRESNDQLLDILFDLNSSLTVPADLRFDVKFQDEWPEDNIDLDSANKMLSEAYEMDRQGRYTHAQFCQMKTSLEKHIAGKDARPLQKMEREIPHLAFDTNDPVLRDSINEFADPVGYLTSEQEEECLKRLDARLGDSLSVADADKDAALANLSSREMDREAELRNPQSVHNWLKKHNISIGEADEKAESSGAAPTGKRGRNSLAKQVGSRAVERAREREEGSPIGSVGGARDYEYGDDDGAYDDAPSRRRKSRDADETYRPKGGRSGKPKRKREDGDFRGSIKKTKTSIGGASDV